MTDLRAEKMFAGWIPAYPRVYVGGRVVAIVRATTREEIIRWTPETRDEAFEKLKKMDL